MTATDQIVLDGSLALAWCFADERCDYGDAAYDAAYLELAMRKGLPLATLDKKLTAAAASVGVPLYQVTP